MEDNQKQTFEQDNTVETAEFSINADENAAGTSFLDDGVEEEGEIEKLRMESARYVNNNDNDDSDSIISNPPPYQSGNNNNQSSLHLLHHVEDVPPPYH